MSTHSQSREVALAPAPSSRPVSVFESAASFADAQRICKALCSSSLVPESYRGDSGMGNALVALDIANRVRMPPLMVMQNLHVIEGKPSWSSTFIIAALNSCGLFSPIRFRLTAVGKRKVNYDKWVGAKGERRKETTTVEVDDKECVAYAVELSTGEVLEGPPVSIGMAIMEGWFARGGSKWQTMPELMLRYRAAAFFGRLYASEILMGMKAQEEVIDGDFEVVETRQPVPVAVAEEPSSRPRGVAAALANAAAPQAEEAPKTTARRRRAEAPPPEPEPAVEDAEFSEPDTGEPDNGDMFDAPDEGDDDDFTPA